VHELNWFYIGVESTAPPLIALVLALPFWLKEQPIFGNLVGTAVIFGAAFVLIMREHVQLDRAIMSCFALAEVIALFLLSLNVERRLRRRGYDPEWR
jgi:hypothetical protein